MTQLLLDYGLVLLFVLVALESTGIPLPGETALIAAGVLASQGHYSLVAVIAVAAAGAVVGDNAGYWLGRKGGRALLGKLPYIRDHFEEILPPAERFFRRHGGKTVFFGRFVAILRITSAWLAGISRMHWWTFLFWNAAGGIVWATAFGIVSFYAGKGAAEAINRYGLWAGVAIIVFAVISFFALRFWRKRVFGQA